MAKLMDFSNVSNKFEPVPAGTYSVEVVEAGWETTSTGTDMLKAVLEITDTEYAGRKLFHRISVTENSAPFWLAFLTAIGRNEEDLRENGFDLESLDLEGEVVGSQFGVRVAIKDSEEYGPQNVIKRLLA